MIVELRPFIVRNRIYRSGARRPGRRTVLALAINVLSDVCRYLTVIFNKRSWFRDHCALSKEHIKILVYRLHYKFLTIKVKKKQKWKK